jgi:glucose/arabinose dehydrogenase
LWFTDNRRDWMGEDMPVDQFNRAPRIGMHFGYPDIHQGEVPDPEYGKRKKLDDFTPPARKLSPHMASLGMRFYTGRMFPEGWLRGGPCLGKTG